MLNFVSSDFISEKGTEKKQSASKIVLLRHAKKRKQTEHPR
ncbi:hypothetical protein Barb7_01168 [Bacteroidales bacterium Barb7]|nr:hypothetical protein Barb7_03028 [Bacteroidales bacterium Barb7]OAV75222.1 hypothetical protein Barb7_01168 [Bacteroidales bacterium Barb7]